jgi:hypothetical protein
MSFVWMLATRLGVCSSRVERPEVAAGGARLMRNAHTAFALPILCRNAFAIRRHRLDAELRVSRRAVDAKRCVQ